MPTKLGFKNPKHIMAISSPNNYPGGYWEDQGYNWFSGRLAHQYQHHAADGERASRPPAATRSLTLPRKSTLSPTVTNG